MKPPATKLYYFPSLDMDQVIDQHIDMKGLPKYTLEEIDAFCEDPISFNQLRAAAQPNHQISKPNKAVLEVKYVCLIDAIICRYLNNERGLVILNAGVLQDVVGKEYKTMLDNLRLMGVIGRSGSYQVGKYPETIKICEPYASNIEDRFTCNQKYTKFKEKLDTAVKKLTSQSKTLSDYEFDGDKTSFSYQLLSQVATKNIESDEMFKKKYQIALSYLTVLYKNELELFVKEYPYENDIKKHYSEIISNKYDNKILRTKLISDHNNRSYHLLTLTPKHLKHFLNIKYSIDIKNAHPLLFSYILFLNYNIDIEKLSIKINNIQISYQYDIKKLCNKIKINNLLKDKNANKIPPDVFDYIDSTFKGKLWDDLEKRFQGQFTRDEIKIKLFKDVYYSKRNAIRYSEFAKAFKADFPNVYKLIQKLKDPDHAYLSNRMMALESEIIREVLARLYKKRGLYVINIHDAIVVLETKFDSKVDFQDTILKTMCQVLAGYGLVPTFSIDTFHPDKAFAELAEALAEARSREGSDEEVSAENKIFS